jgi:hypothetical protein
MTTTHKDEEHLRLLSILYYVWGALGVLFSCLGGIYLLGMSGVLFAVSQRGGDAPPTWVGALMGVLGVVMMVVTLVFAGLSLWTGKCLADRRAYTLCMVVAALSCLSFPFGTALGVFTLIVLSRPSVKAMFNARSLPG